MNHEIKIVCLAGTDGDGLDSAIVTETLAGRIIVCSIVAGMEQWHKQRRPGFPRDFNFEQERERLERMQLAQVRRADESLVINGGPEVDRLTARCIWEAFEHGKKIRFWKNEFAAENIRQAVEAHIERMKYANLKKV